MIPTIHDVARLSHVSIATVSRVIHNPLKVKTETRMRVEKVIEELGYEPNPFASGLRDKLTKTLVAIIPDIANPFYAQMFRGIEDTAQDEHNNVIICNIDYSEERFFKYLRFFKKKKVDGIIFASAPVSESYYLGFEDLGVPVVLVATKEDKDMFPYVKIDDWKASYDATTFLIAEGHQQIGLIGAPEYDPIAGQPRLDGFRAALRENNLEFSLNQVEFADFTFERGYEAMSQLYSRFPQLTAVFAVSDVMALGALSFLQRTGVKVPNEISVLGFDNLALSHMITPALSTIAQPVYDLGKESVLLLLEWINTGKKPSGKVLQHELILRDTVISRVLGTNE